MKLRINLYSQEFRPRRQWLTLPQLVSAWIGIGLLLLAGYGVLHGLLLHQLKLNQLQSSALQQVQEENAHLIAEQQRRQPDLALQQSNNDMLELVSAKQALLNSLKGRETMKSNGFAALLTDLARIRAKGVALQAIQLDENNLALSGQASHSEDVPAWVSHFSATDSLKGRAFSRLEMSRDNQGVLHFHLNSLPLGKDGAPVATASASSAAQPALPSENKS